MGTYFGGETMNPKRETRVRTWAWLAFAANVLVAVNGVFVRASESGAGCGRSWPFCYGRLIPEFTSWHTVVEFGHRLLSALALVFVIGLVVQARKHLPKDHPLRKAVWFGLFFMVTEILAGASLVIFDWVVHNLSWGRVVIMPVHLTNTHLLVAALLGAAWLSVRGRVPVRFPPVALWAWTLVWLVSAVGSITALNETVHYWQSMGRIPAAFEGPARFVQKAFWVHVALAVLLALVLTVVALREGYFRGPGKGAARLAVLASWLQLGLGTLNWLIGMPETVQMLHLLLAYAVWLGWLWMMLEQAVQVPSEASATLMVKGKAHVAP